jgi:hypothetical protein
VQVLQDYYADALGAGEILEKNPKEPVTRLAIAYAAATRRYCLCSNFVNRGQCPWCAQCVAGSPERARIAPMLRHESLNQGTLANPGFARDEDELTGRRACLLKAPVEFFKLFLAVKKVHDSRHYPTGQALEAMQFVHMQSGGAVRAKWV